MAGNDRNEGWHSGGFPALPGRLAGALPQLLLAVVIAAGLALRLRKAWSDFPTLVREATPDDAYYYFMIAQNIAAGHNVTFDGENLTNGFHPLWMVLVTPIYAITDGQELPIRLALMLGAVLGAATVFLIYAIVRTLTGNPWAALAGATFYAIHPHTVIEAVNGMETALAVFMIALTTWLFVRAATRPPPVSRSDYLWLGVSAGLMVLSRTETVFVLPPMLLFFLARERGRQRWAGPAVMGGVAVLVVAPWAIWSLVTFGTVIQVSGVAVPDIERQVFLEEHGSALSTQLRQAWDETNDAFFRRLPQAYFIPRDWPRGPLLLAGAGVLAAILVPPFGRYRGRVARQLGLLLIPGSGVVLALLFHSAVRWHVREWYLAPIALFAAAALGIVIAHLHSVLGSARLPWIPAARERGQPGPGPPLKQPVSGPRGGPLVLALYGCVAAVIVTVYSPVGVESWVRGLGFRGNMLETARWIEAHTDPDARIGSWNAGMIGYFGQRTVINLDGVVNEDAYHARRDGKLREYICAQKMQYLADLSGLMDLWTNARCDDDPCRSFQLVAAVGERLPGLGDGRGKVLQFLPDDTDPACKDADRRGVPEWRQGGMPAGDEGSKKRMGPG